MTKVLVTGGAGFIGSHLVERLLARGDEVAVLDDFTTGRRRNLDVPVVEGSVADAALVERLCREFRPEVVVHAAASYRDPDAWELDAETNVVGTANVVKASRDARRLIYLQTSLCYGLAPEQPTTLDAPVRPEGSSYAISKTAGEQYVRLSELDWLSFRLANVYGPRNLSGPLPTFYSRLSAGKPCFVMNTRRDFIFVDDVVDVLVGAIDGRGDKGVYHVATGRDHAIVEVFRAAARALGVDPEVEVRERNPDDAFTILLDPSKTERDFGWRARVELEEGVARAIADYRSSGIERTFTHLRGVVPDAV